MRVLLQRVTRAAVWAQGDEISRIGAGLLLLVGVGRGDSEGTAAALAEKTAGLRIFPDEAGKFNLSLLDTGGEALVVSQFTLYADTRKGRRPSFTDAAQPEEARMLVDAFAQQLARLGLGVRQGVFGAHMQVELYNDGPVTILLEN